jgi:hypothetical protein
MSRKLTMDFTRPHARFATEPLPTDTTTLNASFVPLFKRAHASA